MPFGGSCAAFQKIYNKETLILSMYIGNYICLSPGYPPMPATLPNAVCGPQVSGTAAVAAGTDMSTLNPCPLNACCDIWGQCGVTTDYCMVSNSTTGAPGTAAERENGCISNCGTSIISSNSNTETFTIGYFEAYDSDRSCLTMTVDQVPSSYSHIHFSFATINADYSINTSMIDDQLPTFQELTGDVKKIVSIGGWDFSTGASTYSIFRDVVSSETSRQTLVTNVINFLDEYDLDGVDWDWEYPDEPDIPDIPAGTEEDSVGYFLLLEELKGSMPSGKTVSLTAPASYWYLQYFPILAISQVVDYIVYMTYDFHGQWDYGNEYADSGCSDGNCLRSHVNLTETITALSMITKAGVESNITAIGVSSYGRSFEMTTAGCWTDNCTYTGPDSGALPGVCTNTAGILADYEIDLIASENPSAEIYWDEVSYSNIMVYNDTQWVAWMNSTNKAWRESIYLGFGFLGSSDWAVDYQSEDGESGAGAGLTGDQINDYPCTTTYSNSAIVGYATSTITNAATVCTGSSSTLQAGKSLTVQMASDMTVAVGTLTGADLFTSVSSALMAGCTIESAGATATECGDIPEITGITYFDDLSKGASGNWYNFDNPKTGGKLKIEPVLMSVYDETVLEALITAIAAALNGTSLHADNTITVNYECDSCYDSPIGWPTQDYTSVSSLVQAIYTEQTDDTNGAETLQNLEVSLTLESDSGEFLCAAGAFVFDALAVIGLLLPGFEWLEGAAELLDGAASVDTWAAGAMSFTCLASDTIGNED
jgi:GH18 family chitinase